MHRATYLLVGFLLVGPAARAQSPWDGNESAARREQRIRLLRFQPGFLADPVNLFPEEPIDPFAAPEESTDWLNFTMGNDNPFTDFRRAAGTGGVGFYRVVGQVQLLDSGSTGFSLNLNAVTPAGREMDGVETGATVFTPALAIYHEVTTGVALHGFVGTNMTMNGPTTPTQPRQIEYGVAFQHPLLTASEAEGGLYLYVGALGRVADPRYLAPTRLAAFEVLPGLHWQLDRRTWLSGAVVVPLQRGYAAARSEQALWQLTAQFQF